MTGYIVADKPEMKIKDFEKYRSYYCGVCKSIGQRYGQIPRLTLSYDSAFLAIVLSSLWPEEEIFQEQHCIVHPVRQKRICTGNSAVDYAADMLLMLSFENLRDDVEDEHRLSAAWLSGLLRRAYRRVTKQYEHLSQIVRQELRELHRWENEACDSLDQISEPFGKIMGAVFSGWENMPDDNTRFLLEKMGFYLGKWMYLIDATDDLTEDIRRHRYNPLITRFQFRPQEETPEEFRSRTKETMRFLLFHLLGETEKAYDLLSIRKNRRIIENILFFGMNRKTEEVLYSERIDREGIAQNERPI